MKSDFSLFDFCKRKADKVQIFGEETLEEDGNIISFSEQAALMTHYLQLKGSGVELPYTEQAEKILDLWHGFIKQEPKLEGLACENSAAFQASLFPDLFQAPFQAPRHPKFTFIDLFAGIGGFRMAFQNLGGRCVFSSEWDEQAKKTYYDIPQEAA